MRLPESTLTMAISCTIEFRISDI
ncbi:hypothetical protein BOSE21B_30355 [Bosea sp. 21B]|nr:hypothetical protein BOSE21B_30355 [Bosea sp. 21B]